MGAVATGALAGAVAVARRAGPRGLLAELPRLEGFGRSPHGRLRAHYAWLTVEPAAFDQYLADYQRVFGPLHRFSLPPVDFYTRFLLSTTFFPQTALRSASHEPISYTAFYFPRGRACFNPLAQRPPSDAELTSVG